MNGVHDMGGMHGFGPVPKDGAAFHADWEKTAYALNKLVRLQGVYNIDEYRHSVERMDPDAYLAATYFERWFTAVEQLLLEKGVLDEEEIQQRLAAIRRGEASDPLEGTGTSTASEWTTTDLRERARASFRTGAGDLPETTTDATRDETTADAESDTAFQRGQTVQVRNAHPAGHTRSPRYARGKPGTITDVLGEFALPDATAHGGDRSEPVYTVEFDANELWGEDTDADVVALDMWESYLREA